MRKHDTMTAYVADQTQPKHRADVRVDSTPDVPCDKVGKGIECHAPWHTCPRCKPANYADMMARHATDSL